MQVPGLDGKQGFLQPQQAVTLSYQSWFHGWYETSWLILHGKRGEEGGSQSTNCIKDTYYEKSVNFPPSWKTEHPFLHCGGP